VHTRVADLYNEPMDQLEQQLRRPSEALRERQEHELVNNHDFGLLHNAVYEYACPDTRGAAHPDEFDELLAHGVEGPGVHAAPSGVRSECTKKRRVPPVSMSGHKITAWRDIPIFPCQQDPGLGNYASSVLLSRGTHQGVVGLHQRIPDEYHRTVGTVHGPHEKRHLVPGQRLLFGGGPRPDRSRYSRIVEEAERTNPLSAFDTGVEPIAR